jgi:hypothetical protein
MAHGGDKMVATVDWADENRFRKNDMNNIKVGAAVGTGLGIAAGGLAGVLEQANSESVVRSYRGPVTTPVQLGHIPDNSYTYSWRDLSDAPANQPVIRDLPVYGSEGSPRLETKTETFDTSRFGPLGGMVFGGLTGLGAGIAGGVAYNVISRIGAYEEVSTDDSNTSLVVDRHSHLASPGPPTEKDVTSLPAKDSR